MHLNLRWRSLQPPKVIHADQLIVGHPQLVGMLGDTETAETVGQSALVTEAAERAVAALASLASSSVDNCQSIMKEGALPRLLELLRSPAMRCVEAT